ncbi:MAG: cupredoxin domain-containing protein [Actinomycetota bacterium]
MKKLMLVAGILTLTLMIAACGGDDAATDAGGGNEAAATVTASNTMFDPEELSVAAGGSVEFVNEDDFEHSFTVTDTDVEEELEEPGSVTVDLSSLEEGSYDFFCEYHPDEMQGTLEITP